MERAIHTEELVAVGLFLALAVAAGAFGGMRKSR